MNLLMMKSTVVAICMALPPMADAAVFELRGHVESITLRYSGDLPYFIDPPDIPVGTAFTGSLSTDDSTYYSGGQSVYWAWSHYSNAVVVGNFGSDYNFRSEGSIFIRDSLPTSPDRFDSYRDEFEFYGFDSSHNMSSLGPWNPSTQILWKDSTAAVFDSTDLPTVLDMSLFQSRSFTFSLNLVHDYLVECPSCPDGYDYRILGETYYSINVTLTDVAEVPLPGAALLFPSALGMFCAGLNRRRRVPRTPLRWRPGSRG